MPQQSQAHRMLSFRPRRTDWGSVLARSFVCYLAVALPGCSAEFQDKIVTTFFDDVKAPPPKRKLREDLQREIDQLKLELGDVKKQLSEKEPGKGEIPPAEKAKGWLEVAKLLPKRADNSIDWTAGINSKVIALRAGIDPRDAQQAVLDLDVELTTSSNALYAAAFPHNAHTQWLSCGNCHPAIYPLKQQGEPEVVTMAKINAGESCGVCHGTVAFPVTACDRCHPATGEKQ